MKNFLKEYKYTIITAIIFVIITIAIIYGLIKWHEATTFYIANYNR